MLAPGTRLENYEVIGPLGAGGMGEVYRARDTRLGRDVAIKALPSGFAQDPERLSRFEREAKLLASLNHPNIAGIHGIEEVAGERYLVLEFVDGETLDAHLKRGMPPLGEALEVAKQIAAGVEAAHEAGVVHRDLKPANVMLTASGGVKVLDFGLAKGGSSRTSDSDPSVSASPTMTYHGTAVGVILGTAAYMSPEQARGRTVDRRTDIWSFGCVLFEILTGRRLYDGETVSDMVARILEREPDWSAVPSSTPPRLVALLKRCLVKDARRRQRDMGDVRLELEAIAAGDTGFAPAPAAAALTRRGLPAWLTAAAWLVVLVIGAIAGLRLAPRPLAPAVTVTLLAPPGVTMGPDPTDAALSPDGRLVVFAASDTLSGRRLWVRSLDRDNARPLDRTDEAVSPFWAPDSRRIGFFSRGKLMTVNVETGAVTTLADTPLPRGGAWGKGVIVFQPRSLGPLMSVPEQGGEPAAVTAVDSAAGDYGHRFPQFLPDQKHFLLVVLGKGENVVAVGSLAGGRPKPVTTTTGSTGATFAAPDWLVTMRDGLVKAQRLDLRTFALRGQAAEVPGVRPLSPNANGSPVVSASATGLLLQRAAFDLPQRLEVVDRAGRSVGQLAGPVGTFGKGSVSRDGTRAVYEYSNAGGAESRIWMADLVRGTMQPLTFDELNFSPSFSPDGSHVAFSRVIGSGPQDLWIMDANSPGSLRLVHRFATSFQSTLSWTPDGRGVLLRCQGTDTQQDLVYVSLDDTSSARTVQGTRFNEPVGAISPDGHWLAYVSDESGSYECRVRAFPDATGQVSVVSHGAYAELASSTRIGLPVWRRDGGELLYCAADGRTLMVVPVTPGNPPHFGDPQPLFRLAGAVADIAVSPGLDRIVLSITREEEGRSAATLLVNWPRLLEHAR